MHDWDGPDLVVLHCIYMRTLSFGFKAVNLGVGRTFDYSSHPLFSDNWYEIVLAVGFSSNEIP